MKNTIEQLKEQCELLTNMIDDARLKRVETYEKLRDLEEDIARKHPEAYENLPSN